MIARTGAYGVGLCTQLIREVHNRYDRTSRTAATLSADKFWSLVKCDQARNWSRGSNAATALGSSQRPAASRRKTPLLLICSAARYSPNAVTLLELFTLFMVICSAAGLSGVSVSETGSLQRKQVYFQRCLFSAVPRQRPPNE